MDFQISEFDFRVADFADELAGNNSRELQRYVQSLQIEYQRRCYRRRTSEKLYSSHKTFSPPLSLRHFARLAHHPQ